MKAAIQTRKQKLRKFLDPRFGLLDELVAEGVLSREDEAEIESEKTVFKQNDRLIEIMADKSNEYHRKFLIAMTNTGQEHVVNYLTKHGS